MPYKTELLGYKKDYIIGDSHRHDGWGIYTWVRNGEEYTHEEYTHVFWSEIRLQNFTSEISSFLFPRPT